MKLQRIELTAGFVKGLVFGVRPYEFKGDGVYEVDHVLYLGIVSIVLTAIYEV